MAGSLVTTDPTEDGFDIADEANRRKRATDNQHRQGGRLPGGQHCYLGVRCLGARDIAIVIN